MLDQIHKIIISTYLKTQLQPDTEEETKAKNQLIMHLAEERSAKLMVEARELSTAIKTIDVKYGANEASKLFKVFPYLRLSIIDLHTHNYYLALEQNELRKKFILRSIALTAFELSEDIHHILGKDFRHALRIFPNKMSILAELERAGKEFKKFEKDYLTDLKEIRNTTIGHRDNDPLKQIEVLDKLDLIKHGIISWMAILWFEEFRKVEQLIFQGIAANKAAKEAKKTGASS